MKYVEMLVGSMIIAISLVGTIAWLITTLRVLLDGRWVMGLSSSIIGITIMVFLGMLMEESKDAEAPPDK